MQKFIESGEYFRQARSWYNDVFLLPLVNRSWVFCSTLITCILVTVMLLVIQSLYPLSKQIMYAITVEDASEYAANIEPADYFMDDTYSSVAKIFVETYTNIREGYDYDDLANRMLFVQNTSTKVIYNRFSDYLSLDNPESPVLRLQRYAKRSAAPVSTEFLSSNKAIVKFVAKSFEDSGKILEDGLWEAEISFVIDQIDLKMSENTPFNFTVSDYKVRFIKDNDKK